MAEVHLPTLHAGRDGRSGQVAAFRALQANRFLALRCGRRWGKTDLGKVIGADRSIRGKSIGWFAPDYKRLSEAFYELDRTLDPVAKASSKVDGVIRTVTDGRLDFWTLEDESAGRSRKYHLVIIDEAAFTKPNMMQIWERSILPTLLDHAGQALVMSNTKGIDSENFFWQICNESRHGFAQYHAPSWQNPYLPEVELERLQHNTPPLVFQQEYLAEFVDWSGAAFFALSSLLENDAPVEGIERCEAVFATIDTAVKAGKEHDATAVVFWGRSKFGRHPLVILDYDIVQIEGALLENWLPNVFRRLEELAQGTKARFGNLGAFIEDKASGQILIQQARRRNWPAKAIESKLTALGKDERAVSVSGYVYRGLVKITRAAYDKVVVLKGQSRNHLVAQVTGFRIGAKDGAADDLVDCFTYGIAIALGNPEGY